MKPHLRSPGRRIAIIVFLLLTTLLARNAGSLLVVDQTKPADAIVVLGGDHNDLRYRRGLSLLREGKSQLLLIDANSDEIQFGDTLTVQAEAFIKRTTSTTENVRVCAIQGDSTELETRYVADCLASYPVKKVLLVTSAFHTRRSLAIFRERLPRYEWSVAAVVDESRFSVTWWKRREWAKTTFLEWTKMLWWGVVDRWRG